MDNFERDSANPISGILSNDRRVTRSVTRALQTQVVGSILTQIDTGIERPIDFVPTDYLNRCANLIFGRPTESRTVPSIRITDEVTVNPGDNSLNFSRKLEKLTEMSQQEGSNSGEVPRGSEQGNNPGHYPTTTDQLNHMMAMMFNQNQMMTNFIKELREVRLEVGSISQRVSEVECSVNASLMNGPGLSSTPDRSNPGDRRQTVVNNGARERPQSARTQPAHTGNQPVVSQPVVNQPVVHQAVYQNNSGNSGGNERTSDRNQNNGASIAYSPRELESRMSVNLDKWHIKFDGTGRDMTVESFIFRIEKMRGQYNISFHQLFSDFHSLVCGNAAKWYWQVLEDNADDTDFGYFELKRELLNHFKSADSDYEIIREIIDYKQQPGQTFEEFYEGVHNLTFRLRKKIPECELIQIIRGNLRSNLAGLIFSSPINTTADLRKECKRAEKLIKEARQRPKAVNELCRESDGETIDLEAFATPNRSIGYRGNQGNSSNIRTNFRPQHSDGSFNKDNQKQFSNLPNQISVPQAIPKTFCNSPFHLNLCFTCGMPGDFYRKNADRIKQDSICKSMFHEMKCFACATDDSFCEYKPTSVNGKVAELTGYFCQPKENPESNQ